jgi:hypothetical protein
MSHVTFAEFAIVSLDALEAAVQAISPDLELVRGVTKYKAYYEKDCEALIRHKEHVPKSERMYEVGVVRGDDDVLRLASDSWGTYGKRCTKLLGSDCTKLVFEYRNEVARVEIRRVFGSEAHIRETTLEDGSRVYQTEAPTVQQRVFN